MDIKDFLGFYFNAVETHTRVLYSRLLPGSTDLAGDFSALLERSDTVALEFMLDFYSLGRQLLKQRPDQAILFNVAGNVCFGYFAAVLLDSLDSRQHSQVRKLTGRRAQSAIVECLRQELVIRNRLRNALNLRLEESRLLALNEIIALQNFSSGGEHSFLRYAAPILQELPGPLLDAGCGTGLSSLVMSGRMDVIGLDASRIRLVRAEAMRAALEEGNRAIVNRLLELIQLELGDLSISCRFPSGEELLSRPGNHLQFMEGRLDRLPFEMGAFRSITCLDVLEHTASPAAVLTELNRVCRPGGRVLLTVPTAWGALQQTIYESIEGTLFPAMLHLHHYNRRELQSLMSAHGFRECLVKEFDCAGKQEMAGLAARTGESALLAAVERHPRQEDALQIFAVYERK